MFITLEGIDGSGKSSQAQRLAERLRTRGHDVVLTREPGGSAGAEEIRALLVSGAEGRWSAETEILLFNAARRDHWERLIAPARAAGKTVICDRFADSTRAYQAARQPELLGMVDALHALAIGVEPDLTLLIDLDPTIAAARRGARGADAARFETMGDDFQSAVRDSYRALAARAPDRIRMIDGTAAPDAVTDALFAAIDARRP